MSKEPEAKGSADAGRKRQGGLRVASDEVPRGTGSEPEVGAANPAAVEMAASVSDSLGIARAGKSGADASEQTPVFDREQTQPEAPLVSVHDEVTEEVEAGSPSLPQPPPPERKRAKTAPVPFIKPVHNAAKKSEAEEPAPAMENVDMRNERSDTSPGFVPPGGASIAVSPAPNEEPDSDHISVEKAEEPETGSESVDIPFDDDDDDDEDEIATESDDQAASTDGAHELAGDPAAMTAALSPASDSKTPAQDAKAKVASGIEADRSEANESGEATDEKKKPRFKRALTMALNESDLEEVRAQTADNNVGTPVAQASRLESGDVLADDDMEEISSDSAGQAPESKVATKKKRADTAEPPPPPPRQKAAGTKVTPQTPAPKGSVEEAKKRQKKHWSETLFDEDYLRTLPFLTPQATQFEAKFVMESLNVDAGAQILDVGCGYGRHAMELAARGYHLVGLDSSLPLLLRGADEAQRRGLSINFVHGDMRDMTYDSQFDGAYCLFSSFGYFDDETNKKTAQNIAKALKPGARFVVEVLNRDYLVADLPSRVWWEGDGCVVLEEVEFNYFSSRIISNRSVVFDDGRQLEHEISLRSFSLHELGKFLHAVGFRVLEISGSMSTRGRFFGAHSRDIVVVAERRATKPDET